MRPITSTGSFVPSAYPTHFSGRDARSKKEKRPASGPRLLSRSEDASIVSDHYRIGEKGEAEMEEQGKEIDPEKIKEIQEVMGDLVRSIGPWTDCPKCGAPPKEQEIRDYDPMWHDGRVYCTRCGSFVRNWDAG